MISWLFGIVSLASLVDTNAAAEPNTPRWRTTTFLCDITPPTGVPIGIGFINRQCDRRSCERGSLTSLPLCSTPSIARSRQSAEAS